MRFNSIEVLTAPTAPTFLGGCNLLVPFAKRALVVALLSAVNGIASPDAHAAFIEIKSGETVSQIVNRLVPDDPARYQLTLRAVIALNSARFPKGKSELVGAGFRLELPTSLNPPAGAPAIAAANAAANAPAKAPPIVSVTAAPANAGVYLVKANDSLISIAEHYFPETPGAIENAIADLSHINRSVAGVNASKPKNLLKAGTVLTLPAWIVTATTTPLAVAVQKNPLTANRPPEPLTAAGKRGSESFNYKKDNTDGTSTFTQSESTQVAQAASATGIAVNAINRLAAPAARASTVSDISDAVDTKRDALPPETVIAQVTTLDRVEAEQERLRKLMEGKPKAYEDKVMSPDTVPAQRNDDTEVLNAEAPGFRAYVGEARIGHAQNSAGDKATEYGLRGEYRHETLNHGEYVAQADVRSRSGDASTSIGALSSTAKTTSARITLRNLGFPVTTQIFADTTLGDQASQLTDAFGRS